MSGGVEQEPVHSAVTPAAAAASAEAAASAAPAGTSASAAPPSSGTSPRAPAAMIAMGNREVVAAVRAALGDDTAAAAAGAAGSAQSASASSSSSSTPTGQTAAAAAAGADAPHTSNGTTNRSGSSAALSQTSLSGPAWFDINTIHRLERQALPEFFLLPPDTGGIGASASSSSSSSSSSANPAVDTATSVSGFPPRPVCTWRYNPYRTPQVYKDLRDWMFVAYHSEPAVYLHVTTCLKFLAADFGAVARIHAAMEQWELINVRHLLDADSRPGAGVMPGQHTTSSSSNGSTSNGTTAGTNGLAAARAQPHLHASAQAHRREMSV